jgi:hypothetical protein
MDTRVGNAIGYEHVQVSVAAGIATIAMNPPSGGTRCAMEVMAESALTPDGRETFRAFLEKRPGVYPPTR